MFYTISIVTRNLEKLVKEATLIHALNTSKVKKRFELYYKDNTSVLLKPEINNNKLTVCINIDFPIERESFHNVVRLNDQLENTAIEYVFYISSLKDMDDANNLIKEYKSFTYTLIPYYTGYNGDFFKEIVFPDKEDLISEPVSMRNIFLHQSLNISFFGKLYVSAAGDIYSNIFSPKLGSVHQHTLLEGLSREFKYTRSWFKLRDEEPCNNCHCQWLCPSPGIYELLLKKNDLCVKNNDNG